MRKGRKQVKYCPVFRPVSIEVIGVTKDHHHMRLMIANPRDIGARENPTGDNDFTRIYVYI